MDLLPLLERRQVPLFLAAIAAGVLIGAAAPGTAPALELAVEPAIAALLLVTFHGIPLTRLGAALAGPRFLVALLAVNLLVVPVIVWALTRPLAGSPDLLLGALLVLLAPCIDYVVVFTALARGAHEKLLAATPLLMLGQILALPVLVPLMILVLLAVTASQTPRVLGAGGALLALVPVYAAFLVLAAAAGLLIARLLRLDAPTATAVTFSGATRNSLVVLPLALAMPTPLAPAAVVAQTLVELVGMVVLVRVLPRLLSR